MSYFGHLKNVTKQWTFTILPPFFGCNVIHL